MDNATDRHFKLTITKVGLIEPKELNEEFFHASCFPNNEIKTEAEFRDKIKAELDRRNGITKAETSCTISYITFY